MKFLATIRLFNLFTTHFAEMNEINVSTETQVYGKNANVKDANFIV